jgi:hypothetical protein
MTKDKRANRQEDIKQLRTGRRAHHLVKDFETKALEGRGGDVAKSLEVEEGDNSQRCLGSVNWNGNEDKETLFDEDDDKDLAVEDSDAVVAHRDDELKQHCYYRQRA